MVETMVKRMEPATDKRESGSKKCNNHKTRDWEQISKALLKDGVPCA